MINSRTRCVKAVLFISLLLLLISLCSVGSAGADTQEQSDSNVWVQPTAVIDCSTFQITGYLNEFGSTSDETVRLAGLIFSNSTEVRAEAKGFLKGLLAGKKVRLEFSDRKRDSDMALAAHVYLDDGTDLNQKMLDSGYASSSPAGNESRKAPVVNGPSIPSTSTSALGSTAASHSANTSRSASSSTNPEKDDSVIVYITKTGSKYHRAGCSALRKSQTAISLKDALARGYSPCSLCHPPTN